MLNDECVDAVRGGFLLDVISLKSTASKPLSGTDLGNGRVK